MREDGVVGPQVINELNHLDGHVKQTSNKDQQEIRAGVNHHVADGGPTAGPRQITERNVGEPTILSESGATHESNELSGTAGTTVSGASESSGSGGGNPPPDDLVAIGTALGMSSPVPLPVGGSPPPTAGPLPQPSNSTDTSVNRINAALAQRDADDDLNMQAAAARQDQLMVERRTLNDTVANGEQEGC